MTYSERAKELARTLRENAEANIRRNMTCAITDKDLDMNPEEESPEEFLARQFYPDNGYESPLRFRNAFVRGYRHARDMAGKDERITAWDRIVRHPFFNAAFDDIPGPLIDSMIELLDKAVSLPSKGENMSAVFEYTEPIELGRNLEVYSADNGLMRFYTDGAGIALGLHEVAALHKALGDHLEAHKRELPREGAVRFSSGQIAVYANSVAGWFITGNSDAWRNPDEIEKVYGTDWEELVVK